MRRRRGVWQSRLGVAKGSRALNAERFPTNYSGADLPLNRLTDLLAPMPQGPVIAALHQEARLRFGSRITQEDPSSIRFHRRFGFLHEFQDAGQLFEGHLLAHFDVADQLGITGPALAKSR